MRKNAHTYATFSRRLRPRTIALGVATLTFASTALVVGSSPAFAAVTPGGMVSDDWSFSGAPSAGLTKLAFPIAVENQPDYASYYWAQQYYLENGQGGYIGLQPRTGGGAAIFSIFGDGTSTTNADCSSGADGGAGTSCSISSRAGAPSRAR